MDAVDPSDFYTGIVAELYRPLRGSAAPDPEPYAAFIAASGEPALELGCGDGDPILQLRERGIDVEGLDSSADMLARLQARADEQGIEVVVHHSTIEAMELPRRYRSIFLAGPTFNLLPDDDTVWHALDRIRTHLEPGGGVLIPLFIPERTERRALGVTRTHVREDGAELRLTPVSETRDVANRLQITMLRYGIRTPDGVTTSEERPWALHWHTQDGFRGLAEEAGLTVSAVLAPDGSPAGPDDTVFVFWLEPDPAWDAPRTSRPKAAGGAVMAAAMFGLEQAIFGERPKAEIVAEAEADGLDLGDIDLDLDDPARSRMTLQEEEEA
jgi:SAM-dependent methyltransferase